MLPPRLPVRCPACKQDVPWSGFSTRFSCTRCRTRLKLRQRYFDVLQLVSIGGGFLLLLLMGVTGPSLIMNAPIAALMISAAVFTIAVRAIPPRAVIIGPPEPLEPDVTGAIDEEAPVVAAAAPRRVIDEDRPVPMHANAFVAGHEHRSFEGFLLLALAIWAGLSVVYAIVEFAVDGTIP